MNCQFGSIVAKVDHVVTSSLKYKHAFEGEWEIIDEDGQWPTFWDEDGRRPVRLVFSRWKVPLPRARIPTPPPRDWVEFQGPSGPLGSKVTGDFRGFCGHRPDPRFLHQEEMNLDRGMIELDDDQLILDMHDPVVSTSNERRIYELDISLNDPLELPLIHVVINLDDHEPHERSYDVFFKSRHFIRSPTHIHCYFPEYAVRSFSPSNQTRRRMSAMRAGACEICAANAEVNLKIALVHMQVDPRIECGFRGYGRPVPRSFTSPRGRAILFTLPGGDRLSVPQWILNDMSQMRNWGGVKVYPDI